MEPVFLNLLGNIGCNVISTIHPGKMAIMRIPTEFKYLCKRELKSTLKRDK